MRAHILLEEPDYSISILYEGGIKAIWLPNLALALYSYQQLKLQLARMGDARHNYSGPPCARWRAWMEAEQQAVTAPQAPPQQP
jgi:hypothetical protein